MKTKKRKITIDKEKFFESSTMLVGIIVTVVIIVKILTNGIGWMSTIGYFG